MKYENKAGTVALALALLCGACGYSAGQGSGGESGSGGKGGSTGASDSGSKCESVQACGGDVVGTWDVSSSCLKLDGEFATRGTGLGCNTAKVTGSLEVKGSFVATDGKFQDKTTTSGSVTVTLVKDCLFMSGTWTKCELIGVAIEGLGFKDIQCTDAAGGGCTCPGKIDQEGNMGIIVAQPEVSGDYTTSGNTLGTGDNPLTAAKLEYSYCVANGQLTVTPKNSSPATSGSIVFKKGGGAGGSGGSSAATGGSSGKGGTTAASSAVTGGATSAAGASGGVSASAGGTSGKGGSSAGGATGGTTSSATGGASGGTTSSGSGSGGSTVQGDPGPCDILEAAKTPCVGAYSMVRAIYRAYSGPVYQVRSKTNTTSTKDVTMVNGVADSKIQDDFCASGGCTVSKIFDQSPKGNHLILSPDTFWLSKTGPVKNGGCRQNESDIKSNPKISVGGKPVYGLKFTGGQGNAYRVIKPTGTAVADEPEYMYSIFDTTVYNGQCCNDFGSAETTGNPDSFTSMEAIYYGNATMWGKGAGAGPWFSCDYEAVISPGAKKIDNNIPSFPTDKIKKFATFIIKGFSGGTISLKYGDSTQGPLTIQYEGNRAEGVKAMKKQGSILLGTGGDGSAWSQGVWFEGAITSGCSSDKKVDDDIQANIVAAKFAVP